MNLPFGLPGMKDRGNRMMENAKEITESYEHKLAEYRNTLDHYRKWLQEYSDKCEEYENRMGEYKPFDVQTAMDLTYIKEQGEKAMELIEDLDKVKVSNIMLELEKLKAGLELAGDSLEAIDKNAVNRISELLIELQKQESFLIRQYHDEYITGQQALDRRVSKGHVLLWFLFVFNLIGLSGIVFLILYVLEVIPF